MSTLVMSACWPLQMPATAKAVLMSLADNANDAGECWPSIETVAKRTCLHRSSVIKAIRKLEQIGHVTADRTNGRHTRYTITPNLDLFGDVKPVADCNPSRSATSSGARRNPSRSATQPVAERDSNRKEPSITKRETRDKSRSSSITFEAWIKNREEGEKAIPDDDPIFDWAENAGIPHEFVAMAWRWFCEKYTEDPKAARKRYTDWRAVFRNAVRDGWPKFWFAKPDGGYGLTTIGVAFQRAHAAREAA